MQAVKVGSIKESQGVRALSVKDQLPGCEVAINQRIYSLPEIAKGKRVVDIGCGYGANRAAVESVGGEWVGVEPFEGGEHTVVGDAENLPFADNSFDVAIMDAVLEHIPDVGKAFAEVARILKPKGVFVGYSAFMEPFHEISYSHLSFRAIEHYAHINGLTLETVSGGGSFGIDHHFRILMLPTPLGKLSPAIAWMIRTLIRLKASAAMVALKFARGLSFAEAKQLATNYYKLECLRQSVGFEFVIRKH